MSVVPLCSQIRAVPRNPTPIDLKLKGKEGGMALHQLEAAATLGSALCRPQLIALAHDESH